MYNIHSHYENIWLYLQTIIADPRLLYLLPYGATQPENLEMLAGDRDETWVQTILQNPALLKLHCHAPEDASDDRKFLDNRGPLFIFYDQEPIYGEFNYRLFDHIRYNYKSPFVLISTEKNSEELDKIAKRYNWPVVYYFHHVFAAHDWYRGSQFDVRLKPVNQRQLTKKYISFNRITSSRRAYRSLLVAELADRGILEQGHVSYNEYCPEGKHFTVELLKLVESGLIDQLNAKKAISILNDIKFPLRIDFKDQTVIPNHSFSLSAVSETQEAFCYLVTETCFWEKKSHLTEKIFKPIISKMPFVLAGPANNLAYLKSYGFKTFDRWIDESYDTVEDPLLRISAIGKTISEICSYSMAELQSMLNDMQPILEHNYQLFNSPEFLKKCWDELTENLNAVEILESFRI
jgi:hypothetical protein